MVSWCVQYVPYVGDSKRAMDEYTSEIFMGGRNTIVMHNTCEDSLLAAPLILDLVLLAELCTRIQFKEDGQVFSHTPVPCLSYISPRTCALQGDNVTFSLASQGVVMHILFQLR